MTKGKTDQAKQAAETTVEKVDDGETSDHQYSENLESKVGAASNIDEAEVLTIATDVAGSIRIE